MNFTLYYPNFLKKAFTVSYDDGVIQDLRLIDIFNKYHIKGTFNLNSGLQKVSKFRETDKNQMVDCSRLDLTKNVKAYDGFEIASHTYSHPFLETLDYDKQVEEFKKDKENLEKIFNREVVGAAYPYGTYDTNSLKALEVNNLKYSRTVKSTYKFNRPYNFLLWNPTIHHTDPLLEKTYDEFVKTDEELALFYLWGHAYEFAIHDNFDEFESFIKKVSENKETYFATNKDIMEYIKAAELVYYKKRQEGFFVNPSSKVVYLITEKGHKIILKPHERMKYEEI